MQGQDGVINEAEYKIKTVCGSRENCSGVHTSLIIDLKTSQQIHSQNGNNFRS